MFPKPNQNQKYNIIYHVKNKTAAQLPLGRSPLSEASSFLLSSTCSRAPCNLCGRMESSSSSCEGGVRHKGKNIKTRFLNSYYLNCRSHEAEFAVCGCYLSQEAAVAQVDHQHL